MEPKLSIICAIAKNRAIGKNNQLLWHIKKDFEHFKSKTMGHVMLMGQKTYESIGRPLPGRITVVVTNDKNFDLSAFENAVVCYSLDEAIEKAKELEKNGEVFVCGGGSIYAQTIDIVDKLYLTIVEKEFEADTFFPEYEQFEIENEKKDSEGEYNFSFVELTRRKV